jgi:predicted Ser/Thr protein kinase
MKHDLPRPAVPRPAGPRPLGGRRPPLQLDAIFGSGLPSGLSASLSARALRDPLQLDVFGELLSDPYTGMVVDRRYVVEGLIAEGGMGRVYQCRHRVLGKKLAIKVMRAELAEVPEATQRFLLEAKAASLVGNEHVIDIIDFGALADGSAYLVMEFLEGIPLSRKLADEGPLPLARLVSIGVQIAEGLTAVHAKGLVHRDLKPDNVFLTERRGTEFVKILDFGVAKVLHAAAKLTQAGMVVGTPHYMSPEQAAGSTLDVRGDIYALGVILYELASGCVPFDAENSAEVLLQQVRCAPPAIQSSNPEANVPAELEAIIARCLAKRPEERFQSMAELLCALRGLLPEGAAPGRVYPPLSLPGEQGARPGALASAGRRSPTQVLQAVSLEATSLQRDRGRGCSPPLPSFRRPRRCPRRRRVQRRTGPEGRVRERCRSRRCVRCRPRWPRLVRRSRPYSCSGRRCRSEPGAKPGPIAPLARSQVEPRGPLCARGTPALDERAFGPRRPDWLTAHPKRPRRLRSRLAPRRSS